jgi:hypothetical protein
MTTNTQLTIRAQAKGGMFLGPDSFNGAIITVRDGPTILAGPAFTNQGDSGTRSTTQVPGSSPYRIRTPLVPPTFYWVVAADTTVNYTATFNLSERKKLTVEARVPLPLAQGDQVVSAHTEVSPGQQPTLPGFVIEIPGLWVQPELVVLGKVVNLKTKVTMMCGCEINLVNSPWIPSDFQVSAQIVEPSLQPPVSLSFNFNSQYVGEIQLTAGNYTAEISARQISTGNAGKATTQFEVRPG